MTEGVADDGLDGLRAAIAELEAAAAHVDGLRARRDDLIREAITAGVGYAAIGEVAHLSRGALDAIRLGRRTRRGWTPRRTNPTGTAPAAGPEQHTKPADSDGWWDASS